MAKIFISYASEDHAVAAEVRNWLADEGHELFLDRDPDDGIAAGEEWEARLFERLRWADVVVCVVTSSYEASVWCTAEAAGARMRGGRLVPLLVEPGTDPPLLRAFQSVDYAADPAAARSLLVESLRRVDATGGAGWPDDRSPFPGLRAFERDMRRAFFGRGEEVEALAALLRSPAARAERSLVLVVGPSGSGKSSLVRAGLVPVMAEEEDWLTLPPFFPGRDPLAALAQELAVAGRRLGMDWTLSQVRERLEGEAGLRGPAEDLLVAASTLRSRRHLLVVVDQLEELVTQADAAARSAFARALPPALGDRVQIVATMRPESLPDLLADPELACLAVRTFALRPLRDEALRAVIEGPADLAGIELDEHLFQRLLSDTKTGDALPLLAFTLARLDEGTGRGRQLSMRRYLELGGVHGALTRQADLALVAASAASGRGRDDVIASLLRLVTVDERGEPARWRARRDELPEVVRTELDVFVEHRLLATDTDERGNVLVGVAHEAILAAWPPLAGAAAAAAAGLRARRTVEQAALEWEEGGRSNRQLWEGNQLAAAMEMVGPRSNRVELSARAGDFLGRSVRRDRGRRRRLVTVLSSLLAVAVAAAGIAAAQAREAARQERTAAAQQRVAIGRELVAEAGALRDTQPRLSLLLSVQALRLDPSSGARDSLLAALTQSHLTNVLAGQRRAVRALAFSPDGHMLATASDDRTVIIWDLAHPEHPSRVATLDSIHADTLPALAFSPDGHTLVTSDDDAAILWSIVEPAHPIPVASLQTLRGQVQSVAFSPDGRMVATGIDAFDPTVVLWDVATRASLSVLHGSAPAFSPDGRTLATITAGTPATVTLWDLQGRANPIPVATVPGGRAAFSHDGRTLATIGSDGAVLWDLTERSQPSRLAAVSGANDLVSALAFSPDGDILATAGRNGPVTLWGLADRAHPTNLAVLTGHTDYVAAIAFSPDGASLAAGSGDRTAMLWSLVDRAHPPRLATLGGHAGPVNAVVFSPDGHTLVAAGAEQTAVWDVSDGARASPLSTLDGQASPVQAAAFSPDGRTLATGNDDGTTTLWNVADRAHPARLTTLIGHVGAVYGVAFSPDGHTLATAGFDVTVELWDLASLAHPTFVATLGGHTLTVDSVAFSPDGRTLATASLDGTAMLWSLGDRTHPTVLATIHGGTGALHSAAFSPDGRTLATADAAGTATLWDLADRGHPALLATLNGPIGDVGRALFSPDGRTLVTAGEDGMTTVWDFTDRAQPARLAILAASPGPVSAVAFSPDGRAVATGDADGTTVLWDVTSSTDLARRAVSIACAIVDTSLTRDEWTRYVPGLPYERTCP